MYLSHSLTDHLNTLAAALDGGDDLVTILDVLMDDVAAAVRSVSGLSVTIVVEREPITLLALRSRVVATSMMLPLRSQSATTAGNFIVFYAEKPGAFVDLAADTAVATGFGIDVVLDEHLPPPTELAARSALDRLSQRSVVDQGIGLLIDQGHAPADAQAELERQAAAAGSSPADMAERLFDPPV